VVERLIASDEGLALLASALNAATRTALDQKVEALGRSLGTLASEPALIDPESIWIRILSDIEGPHVRLMQELCKEDREEPGHLALFRPSHVKYLTGSGSVAFVILQTLISHGMASEVDKNEVGPQTRAQWGIVAGQTHPVWYTRGRLTVECLDRLRASGDGAVPVD
jgi:hypothetical protein